jgi:hypothetical protein
MTQNDEHSPAPAARAQQAILRALTEELRHLDPGSTAAAGLRAQLIEEVMRLKFLLAATQSRQGSVTPAPRDFPSDSEDT